MEVKKLSVRFLLASSGKMGLYLSRGEQSDKKKASLNICAQLKSKWRKALKVQWKTSDPNGQPERYTVGMHPQG